MAKQERLATPPPQENPRFDQDYAQTREIDTQAGRVKFKDLRPPGHENNRPIMVIAGWGVGHNGLRDLSKTLYDQQREALVVDFCDSEPTESRINDRAQALVEVLDDSKTSKTNVVTQSEGAFFASLAAYNHPERFANLVLTVPAGLIGQDSVLKLAGRFIPKTIRGLGRDIIDNPAMGSRINVDGLSYMGKHPVEAARRVQDLANHTIDELLSDLYVKGVRVGVIQANKDPVFPPDRLEKKIRATDQFANVCAYASFVDKRAGHQELMINSENSGLAAIQMLDSLDSHGLKPKSH